MKQGVHGGDVYTASFELGKDRKEIIDFSANVNPMGVPVGVKAAMAACLEEMSDYPDPWCRLLRNQLSKAEQVEAQELICGNGAADLIFRLAYVLRPKKALVLAPTFAEYEQALSQVQCEMRYYLLKEEKGYKVQEDLLDYLDEQIDLLFICNPNNPTGEVIAQDFMIQLLEKCKVLDIWVVVDECFNDFLDEPKVYTLKGYLKAYPKLFVLKAFTKLYAMAGIRLGYGISSNKELLEKLYEAAQPWSVSGVAQVAGCAALEDRAYVEATKVLIKEERAYLQENLRALGFKVYGSCANYIFFKEDLNKGLDKGLVKILREKGILIRDCSNYKGLSKGYYRIGVRTRSENNRLIEALKEMYTWQKQ